MLGCPGSLAATTVPHVVGGSSLLRLACRLGVRGDSSNASAAIGSLSTAAIVAHSLGNIVEYATYLTRTRVWQRRGKDTQMRHLWMRITLVVTAATIISPVQAQTASPAATPPQRPPAAYPGSSFPYPFPAPTPEDAYREGLINRWTYEQFVGPLPVAMQGPSPDGSRGGGGGDARGN